MGASPKERTFDLVEVARLVGLTTARIRSWVRSGVISGEPGPRGELRFSFQEVSALRRLRSISEARIPPRRVRAAVARLRAVAGEGGGAPAARLRFAGRGLMARDGSRLWDPESGQFLFDFESRGAVLDFGEGRERPRIVDDALGWYLLGCELEIESPKRASEAYRRAIELDPENTKAHLNLGCLLHQAGDLDGAEVHYRAAIGPSEDRAVAEFNLGVTLEDKGRQAEAREAYERAIDADRSFSDAHYNLACLLESLGEQERALRHFREYRALLGSDEPR